MADKSYNVDDILNLFKKVYKELHKLECYIEKCCARIPVNIGNGLKLFKKIAYNGNWEFKTLVQGSNITLTDNGNDITISSTNVPLPPTLTFNEIAFGSSLNEITSSPNFTFDSSLVTIFTDGGSSGWGQIQQEISSASTEAGLSFNNIGTGGKQYNLISTSNSSGIGGGNFSIGDATASQNRFLINSSGNIGIGTITPNYKLQVEENIGIGNWELRIGTDLTNPEVDLGVDGGAYLKLATGGQANGKVWTSDPNGWGSWQYPLTSPSLEQTLLIGNITNGSDIVLTEPDRVVVGNNRAGLGKGTFDIGLGGDKGVSLFCAVEYELNWQAGWLGNYYSGNYVPIRMRSPFSFTMGSYLSSNDDVTSVSPDTRELYNSINASVLSWGTNVAINNITYPLTDGTSGQAITTDGAGNLSFTTVSSTTPTLSQVLTAGNSGGGTNITNVPVLTDSSNTDAVKIQDRILDDENGTHAVLWNTSNSTLRYNGSTIFDWKNLRMPTLAGNGIGIMKVDNSGNLSWVASPVSPTPAALTKTDDTNVTLTLGGTPSTALLQATSLTLGWTGTLADSRITSATTWNNKVTSLTAGTGISIGGTTTVPIITNTAPYTIPTLNTVLTAGNTSTQPIAITNGTGISVTNGSQTSYQQPNQFLLKGTTYQGSLSSATLYSNQIWTFPNNTGTVALTSDIPTVGTWGALNYPTWTTGTPFVKMIAAGTFALDTNTYLTSAVTSIATSTGLTGGTITSTGTLSLNSKLTPLDTLTGNSLKLARVNSGETALEYFTPTYGNGTVTSVGLSMPSAFTVSSSPVTTNGTIAVSGAGLVSQYVRGDGTLANFPTAGGGGSSLNYYLNGSVSQGTLGGVAFKQMDKTPVLGAGTDFTINANGYIQSFITDAGVPNQLLIPAGNWNFEMYFSASSNGGSPSFYIELYKLSAGTLTLIASNSATPEGITNGTTIDLYITSLAIPSTTLLAADRLAIRVYVTHGGKTITLHTEDTHLCQVITTFSTGITALNGLTAQVQSFANDTNVTMVSSSSTHTITWAGTLADARIASASTWNAKGNGTVTNVSGTTSRITVATGTTTPVIDISSTFEALLGKVASPLSQFASTTSAQLASVLSDETGTGVAVFSASPALTGTPTAPTAIAGTNTTQIATTAFVNDRGYWLYKSTTLIQTTSITVENSVLNIALPTMVNGTFRIYIMYDLSTYSSGNSWVSVRQGTIASPSTGQIVNQNRIAIGNSLTANNAGIILSRETIPLAAGASGTIRCLSGIVSTDTASGNVTQSTSIDTTVQNYLYVTVWNTTSSTVNNIRSIHIEYIPS